MYPLISIITINFNNAFALEKTISSVVNQTFDNYEYIVIDGASTDNSLDIVEKYQKQISYWISEKDTGIYNAMNKGISAAKGDYLLFLNSGDVLTSNNTLLEFINNPGFQGDIVYGDYTFIDGEKIYPDNLSPYYFMKSSLPHQSTFFNKNVFEIMRNFDETYEICADRAFYLKCFLSNQFKWKHIRYPVTLFDLTGISNNPKYLEKKQIEDERLWKENFGIYCNDYKYLLELEQKLKDTKKQTIKGILKRIQNKIENIWKIP